VIKSSGRVLTWQDKPFSFAVYLTILAGLPLMAAGALAVAIWVYVRVRPQERREDQLKALRAFDLIE
jgi:hypothetical protein